MEDKENLKFGILTKDGGAILDDRDLEKDLYAKPVEKSVSQGNLSLDLDMFKGSGMEKSFESKK